MPYLWDIFFSPGWNSQPDETRLKELIFMKVVFVSLWAHKLFCPDEPQPFGGAELQLKLLAGRFSAMPGCEVHFVTRGHGPAETFAVDAVTVHKLPYRRTSLARRVRGSLDLYRMLRDLDADVYIQRGSGIETGIVGTVAKKRGRRFLFMTSHTWDVDTTHARHIGGIAGTVYLAGLRHADWIITQTNEQHDLLLRHYGKESLVLRSVHSIPKTIPSSKQGVLWIGRCEPWKNPECFLELAEHHPEIAFTMVCPKANSDSYFDAIREKASGVRNVAFMPGISFQETETLFASHKIFVNTSDHEGFPNTFVQAAKWGCPILSLTVNPDRILTEYEMGLCADSSVERLSQHLQLLLSDEIWGWYSRNARHYAGQHHDITVIAGKIAEIIQPTS
jgi:glycosyltransferase involved in cell wall biosynthesis